MNNLLSDAQRQDRRDYTLLHAPGSVTLAPDRLVTLTTDIRVPLYGVFEAGTVAEVCGDCLRFNGGRLMVRCVEQDGVLVSAVALTTPYVPEVCEMVVSPTTGQMVPANSGTARRMMKAQEEMVR